MAALIGIAMFALTSDMAARSGSCSPASESSSSRLSGLYSTCSLLIWLLLFVRSPWGGRFVLRPFGGRIGFATARVLSYSRVADRLYLGRCAWVALIDGDPRVDVRGEVHTVTLDADAFVPAHALWLPRARPVKRGRTRGSIP